MATLQNTTVPDNGYYRVGTSTNLAYISSGGSLANFGNNAWYNGSIWQNGGSGGGPALQLTSDTLKFYDNAVSSTTSIPFSNSELVTTIASTTVTVNGTFGVGEAAGVGATDGQLKINGGATGKLCLEVTNCLGSGSLSTATYSVFKGFLGIKIGNNVGTTAVVPGDYYIRLWSNA